jgi:hypothetical protein
MALAGENFHAWIKSRKRAGIDSCPKKIIFHKEAVKSGKNEFGRSDFYGWHRRC